MPEYSFQDVKTGEVVDLYMPASEAVEIGKVIRRGGRRLRRLAAYGAPMAEPDWAHVDFQHRRWTPGAPRYDEKGRPVLLNKREILNFEARMRENDAKEGIRRDDRYDLGQFRP